MRNRFKPNKKEKAAFERVIKAIKAAKKLGLAFYGKQGALVAYTKYADDYADKFNYDKICANGNKSIPYQSANVLNDSGADDYACFYKPEDNPDHESQD